jgi:L-fuconolactonase
MRIDAHHHLWDPARRTYPWMEGLEPIRRRFAPADLEPLLEAVGVERTVLVQTLSSLDETVEFLRTAAATPFIAGVVGWVDLTDPDVAETIAGLRAMPEGRFLVGIRHQVHDEADPGWLLRPAVQRGIAAVGEAGLAFDLLVRARELPAALETVRGHPRMRFVLDHAAKPRIAPGRWDADWERAMESFADEPHVACKLSGLVTEVEPQPWSIELLEPYVRRVLGWFGPSRCLFGSDWPVCLQAASYAEVMDGLRGIVGDDPSVFGETAARVYGIGVQP